MADNIDSREYREVAKYVESTSLEALTNYTEIPFTPVTGDLQYFPRATPEQRAAELGMALLREQVEETVAVLYALAEAAERKLPIPPAFQIQVRPYVVAFRERENRK